MRICGQAMATAPKTYRMIFNAVTIISMKLSLIFYHIGKKHLRK